MGFSPVFRRGTWALTEPPAVFLWRVGMAWSLLVAVVDALTGRGIVLSGFVLLGPFCVLFTGRWLRTAVAGVMGIGLVVVLGIPDGIWGTSLERFLIGLAVLVAATSTLALVVTVRTGLSLMFTAYLATACGSPAAPASTAGPVASATARPVSCRQQYQAWEHGPAAAEAKMAAAVKVVQAAEQAGSTSAIRSTLRKLMPAALAAAQAPPPRCTDQNGLYGEYVTEVYTAGHDAHSATGTASLLRAALRWTREHA
jgi:hypothetical protein